MEPRKSFLSTLVLILTVVIMMPAHAQQRLIEGLITESGGHSHNVMNQSGSLEDMPADPALANAQTADTLSGRELGGRSSLRLGIGVQTIGGSISQRWTSMLGYEYRVNNGLGVPLEIQLYRNEPTGIKTLYFLSAALKAYIHIIPIWSLFVAGGPQVGALVLGVSFQYSVGTQIFLDRRIALFLNVKRTSLTDLDDFILLGVMLKLGAR